MCPRERERERERESDSAREIGILRCDKGTANQCCQGLLGCFEKKMWPTFIMYRGCPKCI